MNLIPVQYVNPFFVSARRICRETLKLPVAALPPRLREESERIWKLYPISVVIEVGGALRGLISLSLSAPVALALASGLAQQFFDEVDDDVRDALGEVANMMVGSAKRELPGGLVTVSPPHVMATHQIRFPAGLPTILLPFEAPPGRFMMQMSIFPNPAVESAPRAAVA